MAKKRRSRDGRARGRLSELPWHNTPPSWGKRRRRRCEEATAAAAAAAWWAAASGATATLRGGCWRRPCVSSSATPASGRTGGRSAAATRACGPKWCAGRRAGTSCAPQASSRSPRPRPHRRGQLPLLTMSGKRGDSRRRTWRRIFRRRGRCESSESPRRSRPRRSRPPHFPLRLAWEKEEEAEEEEPPQQQQQQQQQQLSLVWTLE